MLHFIKENGMPPELNPIGRINVCTGGHNQIIAFCDEKLNPLNPDCWTVIIDIDMKNKKILCKMVVDAYILLTRAEELSNLYK